MDGVNKRFISSITFPYKQHFPIMFLLQVIIEDLRTKDSDTRFWPILLPLYQPLVLTLNSSQDLWFKTQRLWLG